MSQQHSQPPQPLKLRNPTPYHVLASAGFNNAAHPLSDESLDNYIFEEQQQQLIDRRNSFTVNPLFFRLYLQRELTRLM